MHGPIIKKVAVLGAGVMGAQIAAHCVNAGIETLLFDLAANEKNKNAIIDKAIVNLGKLKPTPLATAQTASLLQAKNYDEDLSELKGCTLIIEAIAERLDWKEDLYKKIAPHVNDKAILVSNTSGLSINTLASVLPAALRNRFCGVHFFNPPRYMHLVELIPAKETSPELLDFLETWLTSHLGKGVVHAKDTPNFIANRIGVFSILAIMHHAEAMNLGLDEVDALTGPLLGRPKSATFRTMDVVGLDTMQHVVKTMQDQLKDDPWHAMFHLPSWMDKLIKDGHLGQKTGQGVYRKPGKTIEVYDTASGNYRTSEGTVSAELKTIMSNRNPMQRMQALLQSSDKQAKFIIACYRDVFHYTAWHLQDIADNVRDVDLAIRWGFGWQQGPFETWQLAGIEAMKNVIEQAISDGQALSKAKLPAWLTANTQFYTEQGALSPKDSRYMPRSSLPVYKRQFSQDMLSGEKSPQFDIIMENDGVRLCRLKDNIAMLSFKSKANSIGQDVLDGMQEAIAIAEQQCRGLIIYQHDPLNFSSGADLRGVAELIKTNKMDMLEAMLTQFQQVAMSLKYSSIPTVAALRGRALGGGCEMMMHCNAVVAAFESYPGLVEAGVGLIPGGGGCKEMAMRAAGQAKDADLMLFIQPYFEQIATAVVAQSAEDAQMRGYLRQQDCWVMSANEVLFAALAKMESLLAANFSAPLKRPFKVAGREGHAKLQAGLVNWLKGGFISEHDYFLTNQLAYILCGGDVYSGTLVDEAWLLKLERGAFMKLAASPLTQARISSLLETGKPLRN